MRTLVAYSESQDLAGALGNVAAVSDETHNVVDDRIRVGNYDKVVGLYVAGGSTAEYARLSSPSLRTLALPEFSPVNNDLDGNGYGAFHDMSRTPIQLAAGENLEAFLKADPASAEQQTIVVELADDVDAPVEGEMTTVRATGTITASAGSWTNGAITLGQTLPVGRYACVGIRAEGTNLVAARFVPFGATHRPGVIACQSDAEEDRGVHRYGAKGVLFEFDSQTIPTVDILASGANTAQTFYLDVIKIS